jgi:hypothetical protein
MKICITCLHVGQMLFAGNKYLLLKRITVQPQSFPIGQFSFYLYPLANPVASFPIGQSCP